jgi:hypothetical protein
MRPVSIMADLLAALEFGALVAGRGRVIPLTAA